MPRRKKRKRKIKEGEYEVFMLRLRNKLLRTSCQKLLDKVAKYRWVFDKEGINPNDKKYDRRLRLRRGGS